MRQILLSILVIGVLLLSACGAPSEGVVTEEPAVEEPAEGTVTEEPAEETVTEQPTTEEPAVEEPAEGTVTKEPAEEPEPIEFSGQGDDVSPKFTLEEGIAIITMTHSGSSNFQLELLDYGGETVDWLVNEIGSFDGRKAIGVREDNWMGAKPGIHLLDITADGNWTVRIEQPRPTSADTLPLNLTGKGYAVSSFFVLNEGLTVFNMSHDGVSNFMVYLLSGDGEIVEYLANEIGSYSGKEAIGVKRGSIIGAEPGIHILSITADGNWTISISQ